MNSPSPRLESLESRTHLAAVDPVESTLIWNGREVPVLAGRWIVQLDNLSGAATKQIRNGRALIKRIAAEYNVERHLGSDGLLLVTAPSGLSAKQALAKFSTLPGFQYAQPDFVYQLDSTFPNDPGFSDQWGLHNTGQSGGTPDGDIDAPEGWDITVGSTATVVGMIDSGIQYTHPDLAPNIWTNPFEIAGNGIDDEGNGFVDDIRGWDFWSGDADPMDQNGHGTHTAGTVAAAGNNGFGVTGVSWNSKLMALKIGGASSSVSSSAAVGAVNYAKWMRDHGVNVRVTNNSWGGSGFDNALYNAMNNSAASGIMHIAAAGNGGADLIGDNNDSFPSYPASFNLTNMVSVANLTRTNGLASSSNYGLTSVDLGAPGTDILSTYPTNSYAFATGTSMASPHVAGVAALLFTANPTATVQQVRDAMLTTVDPVAALSGKSVTGGRVNLRAALQQIAGAPSVPDLAAGSDTGTSSTDNVTNDNTPTFSGTVLANYTVNLFANGVQVGTTVASGAGTWSITASTLSDGVYDMTAVATPPGGVPGNPSSGLSVRIDTVSPAVVPTPTFVYTSAPHLLKFAFSEDVGPSLATSDLTVTNLTNGLLSPSAGSMSLSYNSGTNEATFSFPGLTLGILPDGNYSAVVSSAGVTDVAGNGLATNEFSFFFLQADANRDRVVDITDLGILASNWQQSPRDFHSGDFNNNGLVEISDLGLLATNWQHSVPAPSAPESMTSGAVSPESPAMPTRTAVPAAGLSTPRADASSGAALDELDLDDDKAVSPLEL